MAKQQVVMPQMGESITTGTITKWNKQVGEVIELDEILLEISTDKVESEIPSPISGKIVELLYPVGTTVDVGKVIAYIDSDVNAAVSASESSSPNKIVVENKVEVAKMPATETSVSTVAATATQEHHDRRFYTPLVRKMAEEAGVPLNELSKISGSGAGGRVNKSDLENYISKKPQSNISAPAIATSKPSSSPVTSNAKFEVIPMDNMRKAIAKNMVESKLTSPHVNSIGEVDMSHLVKFRESFKNTFEKQEGFKLTYTPFIMRAIVMALKQFPLVNSSVDGDKILVKKDINLGCAVAVPGNGLVVPVIKNADNLNMLGLCRAINDLANRARARKLTMDDLTGGTFTFTNVGSFGTLMATPVILQPQVGIYASGVIKKRPIVVEDDALAIRSMMYGTHTYDHRIIDGELGGKFLEAIHQNLLDMKPKEMF